jgi:multidrug efflux pump subunit AcrA (membrane-fusion protein)
LPFLHTHRVVRTGATIVALFFIGCLGWAAIAPLESAIVSPGVVVLPSPARHGQLQVNLRIRPQDADEVRTGMTVKVDLSAHKVRRLPMLTGIVSYVSPAAIDDVRTGQSFFLARVSLAQAPLISYPDVRILPGMPVQVEIPTGAHTALDYLLEPIREVMKNGMREK